MKQAICEAEATVKLSDRTMWLVEEIARIGVIKDMALEVLDRELLMQCLRDYQAIHADACYEALRRRVENYWPGSTKGPQYDRIYRGAGSSNRGYTNRACRLLHRFNKAIVTVEFDNGCVRNVRGDLLELVTESN